jgi:hypothetical protein
MAWEEFSHSLDPERTSRVTAFIMLDMIDKLRFEAR